MFRVCPGRSEVQERHRGPVSSSSFENSPTLLWFCFGPYILCPLNFLNGPICVSAEPQDKEIVLLLRKDREGEEYLQRTFFLQSSMHKNSSRSVPKPRYKNQSYSEKHFSKGSMQEGRGLGRAFGGTSTTSKLFSQR